MKNRIKKLLMVMFVIVTFAIVNCSNVSSGVVDLKVDFTWEGYNHCGMGLPQLSINGIPGNTKYLSISMYDHEYGFDHGEVKIAYDGSNAIVKGSYKEITGPCPPPNGQGRYKITVKAIDENDSIIGKGSKEKPFPVKD